MVDQGGPVLLMSESDKALRKKRYDEVLVKEE